MCVVLCDIDRWLPMQMIRIYMVYWVLMELLDVEYVMIKDNINYISRRLHSTMNISYWRVIARQWLKHYGIQKV